ncbi:MAG: putative hydro-lyase [Acetobacterales bacterium]
MNVVNPPEKDSAALADPRQARLAFRNGLKRHTSCVAPGYVQANLAILPRDWASDFLRFCQRNPKPCPLLATSEPGDPALPVLGEDIDLRRDLGSYRVWRDGEHVDTVQDVSDLWQDDFVAFALGCSFSFEQAILEDGIRMRHVDQGLGVPMYRTNIQTAPAGPFGGDMIVSMRSFRPADAIRAVQITSRFPSVHGAPVHVGLPHLIGIRDMDADALGWQVPVAEGEIPLFWACGVTPQVAIGTARPPIAISHDPGYMLVTDRLNSSLAVM